MTARWDLLALVGAFLALVMTITALALGDVTNDSAALIFAVPLALATSGAVYGARRDAIARRRVLLWSGFVLAALGAIALASIGMPIVLAGILVVTAGFRHQDAEALTATDR